MAESIILNLQRLKEYINEENPAGSKECLENVVLYFYKNLNKAELDLAIEVLFHKDYGSTEFLHKTIKKRKLFHESNIIVFNLWIHIIKEHGPNAHINCYVDKIVKCAMQFVDTTQVSAKEKERSTVVIQELFLNHLMSDIDTSEIITSILDIFNIKNHPVTFTLQLYRLLGIICKESPQSVVGDKSNTILNIYMKCLENVVLNEESIQYRELLGAMEGLDMFLIHFAPSPLDIVCEQIYICIKKLSLPSVFTSQKAPFRASLSTFTNHAELFIKCIYIDFMFWQDCLVKWVSSSNYDDRKIGTHAMLTFHTVIAEYIQREQIECVTTISFLLNYFRNILESQNVRNYEMRIAIRGFGMLSGSSKKVSPELLNNMLSLVLQRTELISLSENNEIRDSLEQLPDYVQALSQLVLIVGDSKVIQLLGRNVERIVIRFIKDFHYLSRANTPSAVDSLCKTFYNLSISNDALLDDLLEKVVFQGVIWTCSHKLVFDTELDVDWKENITYKHYLPLWMSFLRESVNLKFDKSLISKKIYNCLMSSLFVILKKLYLKTKRRVITDEYGKDQELYFCDPNIDLCPVRPKDFHIFFNIVDFYRDIHYSNYDKENFRPWIGEYCTKIIRYAFKNPLVSGFLKLLEIGLNIGQQINFFTKRMDNIFNELAYFLKYIIFKAQKFSGELQITSLELILKYPCQFYGEYFTELIPIFKTTFELGKSFIWLAELGINALHRITDHFETNDYKIILTRFYKECLPSLNVYLQSNTNFLKESNIETLNNKKKRETKNNKSIYNTDLQSVKRKILSFLGKLDPEQTAFMITSQTHKDLTKWNIDRNITFVLPMPDMRLELNLDAVIPRICNLAVSSIDRKTKLASCEFIHALLLYLIGMRKHNGRIWKELCLNMLILGSDSDETVQNMFRPLIKQIMHFMSKYENLDNGVDILVDILMNGVSSSSNSVLRDLSAECLREFLTWSIKQTTPEQLEASSVSINVLLTELKLYSVDCCPAKRNGAAIAFNNLYLKLREEETICDIFFIDLLHTFCINFKLTEELSITGFNEPNTDFEVVSLSLDHTVRVLKERSYLFNKENPNRIIPVVFKKGGLLQNVVAFLINETSSKAMCYRLKCIEMIKILAPEVLNVSSVSGYLNKYTTIDCLKIICEQNLNNYELKTGSELLTVLNSPTPHIEMVNLLEYILSSLDCYVWLLSDFGLLDPKPLLNKAKIFLFISSYLKNVVWYTFDEIINNVNAEYSESCSTIRHFNKQEQDRIDSIKCIILIRIIGFFSAILKADCHSVIPLHFWSENNDLFLKLISQLIFEPHILNYDFRSEEISKNLPDIIKKLFQQLQKRCPDKIFLASLNEKLRTTFLNQLQEVTDNSPQYLHSQNLPDSRRSQVRGILFIKDLNIIVNQPQIEEIITYNAKLLLQNLFDGIKQEVLGKKTTFLLPPQIKKYGNSLLQICFRYNNEIEKEIVKLILNGSVLSCFGTLSSEVRHGEHFYNTYKSCLFKECDAEFVKKLLNVLFNEANLENSTFILKVCMDIFDFLVKYRREEIVTLTCVEVCLENISTIIEKKNVINNDDLLVEIIFKLTDVLPKNIEKLRELMPNLQVWVLKHLVNDNSTLEEKSRILSLLPLLIDVRDKKNDEISKALLIFQRKHLPLQSKEFAVNSLEETSFKVAFRSILSVLVSSRSFVVLDFLIKCTASDPKHTLEWLICKELKVYTGTLNDLEQYDVLDSVFEIIINENLTASIRHRILGRFLLNLFGSSSENAALRFFIKNICQINKLIDSNYGIGKSGWPVEQALINRIIGFSLIETFMGIVPKEKFSFKHSELSIALLKTPKSDGELIATITKKAFYARSDIFVTDERSISEFFRLYQCAAYRALCAIVANTQTKLEYYTKFIFQENPSNNEYIWKNLIDCSAEKETFFVGQEFDVYPRLKKRFVAIRKLNPSNEEDQHIKSSEFLQFQNIFESSLSQDVNKIDMNHSTVRTDVEAMSQKEKRSRNNVSVTLESHILNDHEIMPTICGVIKHMHEQEISPIITDLTIKKSYAWVDAIAKTMGSLQTHKNVRVFLAQVVDNCQNIFLQYGHVLFRPILEVLVDECGGKQLNIFITDMIALLLSWTTKGVHKPTTQDEIRLASGLLNFLMKNVYSESKQILKFNLELIRTVIFSWKDILIIPTDLLLEMMQRSRKPDVRDNEIGIILAGIVILNTLIPWGNNKDVFLDAILMNVNNVNSSIYQISVNVAGMCLEKLKNIGDVETLDKFYNQLIIKLKTLKGRRDNKSEKIFLDFLYGVHKFFPEILDSFAEIIAFKIPVVLGAIKKLYLEMLLTRIDSYEEEYVYHVIISIGIKDLLKHADYQLLALHLINRAVKRLKENEYETIYEIIGSCSESNFAECRDIMYEVFIYVFKNYESPLLKKHAANCLLNGLVDRDPQIRKRIFDFWSTEANLPENTSEKIQLILKEFGVNCDKHFFGFCVELLLEKAIRHPDSREKIFAYETDTDSKFFEYNLNANSRVQNSFSLPPLFAETSFNRNRTKPGIVGSSHFVRATNDNVFFEPTQRPEAIGTTRKNFSLPTQSSLALSFSTQNLDRQSKKVKSDQQPLLMNTSNYNSVYPLRRRFLKNKENKFRNEVKIGDHKQITGQMVSDTNSENRPLVLYRRYRIGDYPDLLINRLAYLLPLQGIVEGDEIIARQLFVSMITSIVTALGKDSTHFMTSLGTTIENIFTASKSCEPTTFSALIEISLIKPHLCNIEASTVATIAKTTSKLTIGALYLEERINVNWDFENLSLPKSKITNINTENDYWLHLSDIYTSLKEYDVVASIFANKIDTDPRLAEAIELKSNGLFRDAINLLNSVIKRNNQIEQYYAYNCYYDCIMELGDWSGLSDIVQQQIDDVEELWTDEYNTSFILPKLMQAELQLILSNTANRNKNFLTVLENWMRDPIKNDCIATNFCEELMMLHIANQDYSQARVYCEKFLKTFFIHWEVVDSFCTKLKLAHLLDAQRVSEIDHYALMLLENFNESSIETLQKRWENCQINKNDSLLFWNSIVSYRSYIAALVTQNFQNLNSHSNLNRIHQALHNMELQMFSASVYQNNLGLAKHYLQRLPDIMTEPNERNDFEFRLAKVKFRLLEGKQHHNLCMGIEWMQQAWTSLKSLIYDEKLKLFPYQYLEALKVNADIGENIVNLVKDNEVALNDYNNLIAFTSHSTSQVLKQRVFEECFYALQESAEFANNLLEDVNISKNNSVMIADSFYKLGQFCFDYNDNESFEKNDTFQKVLLTSMFKAMRYDSKDAQQMFGCILQLPSINDNPLQKIFVQESANIPVWMFLSWIPQLIAKLRYEQSCCVDSIVQRVSESYPNAIKYPFDLWYERMSNDFHSTSTICNRETIRNIKNSLKNPLTEKFIECFKYVCIPEILLISLLEMLNKCMRDDNNLNQKNYYKIIQKLIEVVYPDDDATLQGPAYRRIHEYKSVLTILKNKQISDDSQDVLMTISKIITTLRSGLSKLSTALRLETICPWLANFLWCGDESSLELPGQYFGKTAYSKPFVQNHVKIVKFNKKIRMFHSLRCPIRLIIHGSDGKSYEFLIKFGDDLKQDQRIQQILGLMSDKLAIDRNSQKHNLFVRVYNVIPIYEYCGILKFVRNSISIREMIEQCFKRREKKAQEIIHNTYLQHINFIKECSKNTSKADITTYYGNAVCTYSREKLLQHFRSIENNIDLDIIKYALIDLSVSPESFFALRNNFATSLATMNISNWILGITDRHLQNLLINVKDGTITGIDFGMTFGSGTRDLSVPELTPFRLTPHFVHALNPMGTNGLVFKCMSHALRVFQQSKKMLLAHLEIYINDPTVIWLNKPCDIKNEVRSESNLWEPKDRIDIAKCKLIGFNPMHLFERELKVGVISKYPIFMKGYIQILQGNKQFNIRSRLPANGLSVENQVKCLIDQATDPAILGIAYAGLSSWI